MNERIKWMLEDLHDEYGTLDPFHIIEMNGIVLEYVPFKGKVLGLYTKILGDPTIFLNDKLIDSPERYFVAGHELCHALEHKNMSSFYSFNSRNKAKLETEANAFATGLCFNLYIEEHDHKSFTMTDLHKLYGVPLDLSELYL